MIMSIVMNPLLTPCGVVRTSLSFSLTEMFPSFAATNPRTQIRLPISMICFRISHSFIIAVTPLYSNSRKTSS